MKIRSPMTLCALTMVLALTARAGDAEVNISAQPKKLEDLAGAGHHTDEVSRTQQWGYAVTMENETFKPIDNLDVEYIIFYKHEQLGIKGPPQQKRVSGSHTVKEIDSLAKLSFDTDPVELTKAALIGPVGGYSYFTNGAKPKAEDSLTGIWIRTYRNGSLFSEYAFPSDLPSRENWDQ